MKPNIVFILIDDMGWRDLACYGSSFYQTPNIDKLASWTTAAWRWRKVRPRPTKARGDFLALSA